jgi:hypothetical protein
MITSPDSYKSAIQPTELQRQLLKEEAENPFVKAIKKVWETVKWMFEQIVQFCLNAWHHHFGRKVDTTTQPQKEKITKVVNEIVSGKWAIFTDSKTDKIWFYSPSILDSVREKLVKKGFKNRITLEIKKTNNIILSEEYTNWYYLSLTWSKFSKEEIIQLAIQQIKNGEKLYFHCGAHGSTSPYRLELAPEVKNKLIAKGYLVQEEEDIDDGNSATYGEEMKGWVDGIFISATKNQNST